MPNLILTYPLVTGPANVQYACQVVGFSHGVDVPEGYSSTNYADEAERSLCDAINSTLEEGAEQYSPPGQLERKFAESLALAGVDSAYIPGRIMAWWRAYNEVQLEEGTWTPQEFAVFMGGISQVLILLNALAYGTVVSTIAGYDGEVYACATPQAKRDYLDLMARECPQVRNAIPEFPGTINNYGS